MARKASNLRMRAVMIAVAFVVMVVVAGATPNVAFAQDQHEGWQDCTADKQCKDLQTIRLDVALEGGYWGMWDKYHLALGTISLTMRYQNPSWSRLALEGAVLTGGAVGTEWNTGDRMTVFVWGVRLNMVIWVNEYFGISPLGFQYQGANSYDMGVASTFSGRIDLRFQFSNLFLKLYGLAGYGLLAQEHEAPQTFYDREKGQYVPDYTLPPGTETKQYEVFTIQGGVALVYRFY